VGLERGEKNDDALSALGIFDFVFSGHAHHRPRRMDVIETQGKTLLHPGVHNGQAVVWGRFKMEREEGCITRCISREGGADLIDEMFDEDAEIKAWLQGYSDQFEAQLNVEIGACVGLSKYDGEPPINHTFQSTLAEAMLATFSDTGASFSAMNAAGIRGEIPPGVIQYRHIEAAWPWKNNVYHCELSGALIMDLLQANAVAIVNRVPDGMFLHFSGLDYDVVEGEPINVIMAGAPLNLEAWYGCVADQYLITSAMQDNEKYPHAGLGQRKVMDMGVMTQTCILDYTKGLHAQGLLLGAQHSARTQAQTGTG